MMKPEDFRNLTWLDIQSRLHGLRQITYEKLQARGPSTTRQLAEFTGLDLLTVRPRITELCQLGLARPCGRFDHQGIYEAVPMDVAEAAHAAARAVAEQLNLARV